MGRWQKYRFLGADLQIRKLYQRFQVFECICFFSAFFSAAFGIQVCCSFCYRRISSDKPVHLASPPKDRCRIYLHMGHVSPLTAHSRFRQIRSHLRKEVDDGPSPLSLHQITY